VPGASRNCITGLLGESLKVCVKVRPEKGKVNSAVEKLIAQALGISTENSKIVRCYTSAHKVIEITGLSESAVRKKFENTKPRNTPRPHLDYIN